MSIPITRYAIGPVGCGAPDDCAISTVSVKFAWRQLFKLVCRSVPFSVQPREAGSTKDICTSVAEYFGTLRTTVDTDEVRTMFNFRMTLNLRSGARPNDRVKANTLLVEMLNQEGNDITIDSNAAA